MIKLGDNKEKREKKRVKCSIIIYEWERINIL